MNTTAHRNSLQPGYRLHWYHIEKILGQGGFGITYLARDTNLDQLVAIKEYLPVELAVREDHTSIHPVSGEHGEQYKWGLERFITEAQTLARFKHPNIIRVLAVFRENNTAYMVMEYEQGRGLHELLREQRTLDEDSLNKIILPILDGLEAVHQCEFIHRDIKPPNIYIRNNNSPVLLDFGSARQSLGVQTRTLTTLVSPGYAPFEQYVSKSKKQGPWTDIYGLGATLYRSVTGVSPPDSMHRSEAILHTDRDIFVSATEIAGGKYSGFFLAAIDHAMAFKPEDRPQSIAEWRCELQGEKPFPGINKSAVDNNIVPDTQSEIATQKLDVSREDEKTTAIPVNAVKENNGSVMGRTVDASYGLVMKLLKWGSVLLLVLILLAVFTKNKNTGDRPGIETAPVTEDTVSLPPGKEAADGTTQNNIDQEVEGQNKNELVQQLLAGAEKDIKAHRLTSPPDNNAWDKYQQVLELEPGNRKARLGIDNIVTEYIRLMDSAIRNNNLDQAEDYLNKAIRINPDHVSIDAARQRLADARLADNIEPETAPQIPEQTATQIQEPAPVQKPEPESVKEELQSLQDKLRENPRDPVARKQLNDYAKEVEKKIKQAMDDGDYDLAREYVHDIQSVTKENSRAYKRLNDLLKKIDQKSRSDSR